MLKIKAIVDSLLAIGDSITEQDQVDAILVGLPEEYNTFVMMMYGKLEPISYTDLESLLLVQESQLEKFRVELTSGTISVNVAQGSNKTYSQYDQNYNRGGRSDRGRGGRGNRGNIGRGRGQKPTCQLCFKYGHDAYNYWNRFDPNFVQPPPPSDEGQFVQQFSNTYHRPQGQNLLATQPPKTGQLQPQPQAFFSAQ